jgi:hypothetical protein
MTPPALTGAFVLLVALLAFHGSGMSNKTFDTMKTRFRAWEYVWRGPGLIQEGYDNAKGQPYEVMTPDTRYVFVSSPKHIEELDQAPDAALSLQAAARHVCGFALTLQPQPWHRLVLCT